MSYILEITMIRRHHPSVDLKSSIMSQSMCQCLTAVPAAGSLPDALCLFPILNARVLESESSGIMYYLSPPPDGSVVISVEKCESTASAGDSTLQLVYHVTHPRHARQLPITLACIPIFFF